MAATLRRRLRRGGILRYDHRVVPSITTRRASRSPINDYLPGRPKMRGPANTRDDALRQDLSGVGFRPNPSIVGSRLSFNADADSGGEWRVLFILLGAWR